MPSKSLRDLNNGWPFSEHPMMAPVRFENRPGECPVPAGDGSCGCDNPLSCVSVTHQGAIFMVCASCPQAIFAVTEPSNVAADPEHPASYTTDLATLKARITDHWLKCHEDQIASATWW